MPRSTAPPPQLLYVIVARYKTVLAEYTASSGNFTTVTRSLLAKLPTHDESMTIVYDNHCFHYIISDDIVFLCMAEEGAKRRIPFAFLHDVRSRWRASYGDAGKTADAFAMQDEFGGLLRTQMEYFNELNHDSVRRVESQLDEVKEVMVKNISKVLDRGDRIELMVDKTDELSRHSYKFQNNSRALRDAMCWNNAKLTIVTGSVITAAILVLAGVVYWMMT